MSEPSVFSLRLKAARLRAGLTQMELGVRAQIDEYSASARINQYERGKHVPDLKTAERLAAVLGVPTPYLYTRDEVLAELLLLASRLSESDLQRLFSYAVELNND